MADDSHGSTPLASEADIVASRHIVRQLTQALKFSLVDQTKMITAASELSRNTLVHGGGGQMRWELLEHDGKIEGGVLEEDVARGVLERYWILSFIQRRFQALRESLDVGLGQQQCALLGGLRQRCLRVAPGQLRARYVGFECALLLADAQLFGGAAL